MKPHMLFGSGPVWRLFCFPARSQLLRTALMHLPKEGKTDWNIYVPLLLNGFS
jgi:hypothetical protein